MDKLKRQMQMINYFYYAIMATIICLIIVGVFGIITLLESQSWVDHSNSVISEIKSARKKFLGADYAGRNRIFTNAKNEELTNLRQDALTSIKNLKSSVVDNELQTESINQLLTSVESRFQAQDQQFSTIVRDGDKIIYDLDVIAKNVAYTENVETLFSQLELNELSLIRLERMPRLVTWQWIITILGFVMIGILLTAMVAVFVLHRKTLKRMILLTEQINKAVHESAQEDSILKDLAHFSEYLKGAKDEIHISTSTN